MATKMTFSRSLLARTIALIVAPFAVVSLLVLLLGFGLHNVPIAVSNADAGFDAPGVGHVDIPKKILGALEGSTFSIRSASTAQEARDMLSHGDAQAAIIVPAGFTASLVMSMKDPSHPAAQKIGVLVSSPNPILRLAVAAGIARAALGALGQAGASLSPANLPIPFDVSGILDGITRAPAYLLTVLLGFICWVLTGLFALSLGRDVVANKLGFGAARTFGVVVALGIAGGVLYLLLIIVVAAVSGVSLTGGFFAGIPVVVLLTSSAASIAVAGVRAAGTTRRYRAIIPYLVLPIFVGGFFVPGQMLPVWLQWLPYLFPPHFGLAAIAAIAAGGHPADLTANIVVTAAWTIVFLALALAARRTSMESPVDPAPTPV